MATKIKYDTRPLVELIKSSLKNNGGIPRLEKFTRFKSDSTYYERNAEPDTYKIGELRDLVIAFDISKVRFLQALVIAFDIPADVVSAVAVLLQVEKK